MAILIVLLVFVVVLAAAYIVNGWALMYLWSWFMVPLGLPELSLSWAIGVAIIVSFLTNNTVPQKKDDADSYKALLQTFVRPLFSIVIGWIVHRLMHS